MSEGKDSVSMGIFASETKKTKTKNKPNLRALERALEWRTAQMSKTISKK